MSGSRLLDEIRADADARIAEAQATAAKASEHAQELEKQNLMLQRDVMLLRLQLTDPHRSQAEFDSNLGELNRQLGELLDGGPAMPRAPNISCRSVGPRTRRRKLADDEKQKIVEVLGTETKGAIEIVCAVDKILKTNRSNMPWS